MQTLNKVEVNAEDFNKLEQVLSYLDKAHTLLMEIRENIVPYDEFPFDFRLVNNIRLATSATETLISANQVPEETVTVLVSEIFRRCDNVCLHRLGYNPYALNEGYSSRGSRALTKEQAKKFMSEEEFNIRKYAK